MANLARNHHLGEIKDLLEAKLSGVDFSVVPPPSHTLDTYKPGRMYYLPLEELASTKSLWEIVPKGLTPFDIGAMKYEPVYREESKQWVLQFHWNDKFPHTDDLHSDACICQLCRYNAPERAAFQNEERERYESELAAQKHDLNKIKLEPALLTSAAVLIAFIILYAVGVFAKPAVVLASIIILTVCSVKFKRWVDIYYREIIPPRRRYYHIAPAKEL
jgi:hypothetical protein